MVFLEHSRVPEIHPKKRGIERFSSFSIRKLSRQTFTVVDTEAPASPTSGRMEIPPQQGHHFKWIFFQLPIFGIFRGVLDRFSGGVHGSTNLGDYIVTFVMFVDFLSQTLHGAGVFTYI